jgi:hypothetical protein
MLFTIISDNIDKSHRRVIPYLVLNSEFMVTRTRYMYIMDIGPHISDLITPLMQAATISVNIWLPFFVAIGVYILMLLMILANARSPKTPICDSSRSFKPRGRVSRACERPQSSLTNPGADRGPDRQYAQITEFASLFPAFST